MKKLNEARKSLLRTKESAAKRLAELDDERKEVRASLRAIDAALKALGGTTPDKRPSAASTDEVAQMVGELLLAGQNLTQESLLAAITDRFTNEGRSRSGLKLRLIQALKRSMFHVDKAGHYSLKSGK